MLEIYINQKKAVLYADTEICLSLRSALLDDETDDSSIPFSLPLKPNRSIFGNIDTATHNTFPEYDAQVISSGILVFSGKAVIDTVTEDEVEVNLQAKTVYSAYEDTYIDELSLGSYTPTAATSGWIHNLAVATWNNQDDYPFIFATVKDDNTEAFAARSYINKIDHSTCEPETNESSSTSCNYLSPFLYVREAIKKILTATGYTIANAGATLMDWMGRIIIISYSTGTTYRNLYRNIPSGQTSVSSLPYKDMLPHITVKDFLNEVTRKFGIRFIFNDTTKEVMIVRQDKIASLETAAFPGGILDGLTKTAEESDIDTDRLYFYDSAIKLGSDDTGYDANLSYISSSLSYGSEDDNDQTIQCISHPCRLNDTQWPEDEPLSEPHISSAKYDGSEFLLAVCHAVSVYVDSEEHYFPDTDNANGDFSLYWPTSNGLYEKLHKPYYTIMAAMTQSHEIYLKPTACNIAEAYSMFCKNIILKGQKYAIREQEITIGRHGVTEWKLTAIPV